jgi:hypothetical protein
MNQTTATKALFACLILVVAAAHAGCHARGGVV